MKKLITWTMVLALCLALVGCAKDENSIVGIWKTDDVEVLGTNVPSDLENSVTFYFNEDFTGKEEIVAMGNHSEHMFTYTLSEGVVTMTFENGQEYVWPYQLDGAELTMTQGNSHIIYHSVSE